jgi:hypothetical protein
MLYGSRRGGQPVKIGPLPPAQRASVARARFGLVFSLFATRRAGPGTAQEYQQAGKRDDPSQSLVFLLCCGWWQANCSVSAVSFCKLPQPRPFNLTRSRVVLLALETAVVKG